MPLVEYMLSPADSSWDSPPALIQFTSGSASHPAEYTAELPTFYSALYSKVDGCNVRVPNVRTGNCTAAQCGFCLDWRIDGSVLIHSCPLDTCLPKSTVGSSPICPTDSVDNCIFSSSKYPPQPPTSRGRSDCKKHLYVFKGSFLRLKVRASTFHSASRGASQANFIFSRVLFSVVPLFTFNALNRQMIRKLV